MSDLIRVINCTQYFDNPYQRILLSPLADRVTWSRGTVEEALEAKRRGERVLLHVHWEEHLLRGHATALEAKIAGDFFVRMLQAYRKAGGPVVWTIHNGQPHELEHLAVFKTVRQGLAAASDRILVHNTEAITVLAEQVPLDRAKVFFLPHPSYLGEYELEAESVAAAAREPGRDVLVFGKLRRYKAIERLIDQMPPELLARHGAGLRISGEAFGADTYIPELQAAHAGRDDIAWDVRRIPDEEVPALLRGARCVVLPYERFLTSGVALLCLTLGVPLVGPRSRSLQEVVPVAAQSLLFDPAVEGDLARAVEEVLALPAEDYAALCRAYVQRAAHFHPRRIARLLGGVYDDLLG
jgi:glycosyltransferase involved in cell wall biosynthesis